MLFVKGFLCLLVSLRKSMHESHVSDMLHANVSYRVYHEANILLEVVCAIFPSSLFSHSHFTHFHPLRVSHTDLLIKLLLILMQQNCIEILSSFFLKQKHPIIQRPRVCFSLLSQCFQIVLPFVTCHCFWALVFVHFQPQETKNNINTKL